MAKKTESLRERRKRETLQEIHAAALRLASEHGFEKITVEMISEEAGVSTRTFFNYFPNKESAVVRGLPTLSAAGVDAFVAPGPGHPREVLADLTEFLVTELAQNPPERAEMHAVRQLALQSPVVRTALLAGIEAFQQGVTAAAAQRLGVDEHDEVPKLMSSLAIAAVRTGLERWSAAEPGHGDDSMVPYIRRAMDLMHTLLTP
ncbi:TetR family transcriptional regulator [Streptomyces sp. RG80]|uniref:TetR family transcriptional regulator n=1 Tax=Streptomyces sp. RG80 TaxID=3157340 RepID=UPI00338FA7D5